jgi:hypothetical protein
MSFKVSHLLTIYNQIKEYPKDYALSFAWKIWKRGNLPYKHGLDAYTSFQSYDWFNMGLHSGKTIASVVFD